MKTACKCNKNKMLTNYSDKKVLEHVKKKKQTNYEHQFYRILNVYIIRIHSIVSENAPYYGNIPLPKPIKTDFKKFNSNLQVCKPLMDRGSIIMTMYFDYFI